MDAGRESSLEKENENAKEKAMLKEAILAAETELAAARAACKQPERLLSSLRHQSTNFIDPVAAMLMDEGLTADADTISDLVGVQCCIVASA